MFWHLFLEGFEGLYGATLTTFVRHNISYNFGFEPSSLLVIEIKAPQILKFIMTAHGRVRLTYVLQLLFLSFGPKSQFLVVL